MDDASLRRFNVKWDLLLVVETLGPCWNWSAGRNSHGYGNFRYEGRTQSAHKVAYRHWVGEVQPGLQLDHLCRNRACVRPSHLEPVTCGENLKRGETLNSGAIPGYRPPLPAACPQGHPYDDANTITRSNGYHSCRECGRRASLAWYHRNKERAAATSAARRQRQKEAA